VSTNPLTELLSQELVVARRNGDRAVAASIRTTLAALANAEAVSIEGPADVPMTGSAHVAGARLGVSAGEAPRRELSVREQRSLVRGEIASLQEAARLYERVDPERAADARRGAGALTDLLVRFDRGEGP
jgi:hypothetical protein